MYSHVTTLTFTVTYEKIELLKGHLLSFVVSYHLFVFFNNANTVSAEMWVWGFGNHTWYKSLVKSLVFDLWLETFVSLVISKTPYSHFLLTVFSHCVGLDGSDRTNLHSKKIAIKFFSPKYIPTNWLTFYHYRHLCKTEWYRISQKGDDPELGPKNGNYRIVSCLHDTVETNSILFRYSTIFHLFH